MFSKIKWHNLVQNPEDKPKRNGRDFFCLTDSGYFQVLDYYDGFNCTPNSKEYEIRVFLWADVKEVRRHLISGDVLAALQEVYA